MLKGCQSAGKGSMCRKGSAGFHEVSMKYPGREGKGREGQEKEPGEK